MRRKLMLEALAAWLALAAVSGQLVLPYKPRHSVSTMRRQSDGH